MGLTAPQKIRGGALAGNSKYPLLGYQILKNPEQPTIVAIVFDTEAGPSLFAATREILEELAEGVQRQASNMPRRKDQN